MALICNEEGKLMGLPLNRALFDDDGHIYDIVSGNFLIVGLGEENFTDLSPDLMENMGSNSSTLKNLQGLPARSLQSSSLQPMSTGKTDDAPSGPDL